MCYSHTMKIAVGCQFWEMGEGRSSGNTCDPIASEYSDYF